MCPNHIILEEEEGNTWYGYGWALADTSRGTRLITHNGGNNIYFADMRRYLDDNILILYMTNTAPLWKIEDEPTLRRMVFE